jgi:putative ABC transport system permease protein
VIGAIARESTYRFRATWHQRWAGYLSLVVLTGLVGGVAMAAVAGARRTQSSYPAYVASTNPTDVQTFTEFTPISGVGYSAKVDDAVKKVPGVAHVFTVIGFNGTLQVIDVQGAPGIAGEAPPAVEGSPDGEYFTSDRVSVIEGRRSNPTKPDELMLSAGAAASLRLHVGSTLRVAFFTTAQVESLDFSGYPADRPHTIVPFRLVGIIEYAPQVVADDNAALSDQLAVLTPALTKRLESCCAYYSYVSLHLHAGSSHSGAALAAIRKVTPKLGPIGGSQTLGPIIAKAERAIRPVAIAIGVFGLIAALAALVIGSQIISRSLRRGAGDQATVRALGATPAMVMTDGVLGLLGASVAGAVLAVIVAVALSPLSPLGPVRPVYPQRGIAFDWTVLGAGFAILAIVLAMVAVVQAARLAPHRTRSHELVPERARTAARATAALPPSAALGIRSALGWGTNSDRNAAPVRSALLGAVVAVVVIVASVTFGSSLGALVSHPSLYGWNWDYALLAGYSAEENLPAAQTASLLDHDPYVAHWTGVYFEHARLDHLSLPVLAMRPNAAVTPSMLSGHPLASPSQVVLGPATLAALHTRVGGSVVAQTDKGVQMRLRVVGTATLPTAGGGDGPVGLQMGSGAVMATSLFSPTDLNQQGSPIDGPMAAFITLRPDVSRAAGLRSLDHITTVLDRPSDPNGPVGGVVAALRPAEIADSRTVSGTPALLAAVLAGGALAALALTLVASVRQRRREFAVLKALGCTQPQLAATVTWQSSVAALVGVVVGVPIGVALGRWLWTLFAEGISAVPNPTVPVVALVLIAFGAVAFAVLVAVVPGRIARRTRTAVLLHSE